MEVKSKPDKKSEKTLFTWTMMIMQPEFNTKDMLEEALEIAKRKGKLISQIQVAVLQI